MNCIFPAHDAGAPATRRAALVWCVPLDDDPVAPLDDPQRIVLLNALLPAGAGRVVQLSALKRFALGLNAETAYARVVAAFPSIWTNAHRGDGMATVLELRSRHGGGRKLSDVDKYLDLSFYDAVTR